MTTPVCRLVRIEGRVQGVGYREACVAQARALGLSGWVRNRFDGSVEALVCGPANAVARMLDWMRVGPPAARVTRAHADTAALTAAEVPLGFDRRPSA